MMNFKNLDFRNAGVRISSVTMVLAGSTLAVNSFAGLESLIFLAGSAGIALGVSAIAASFWKKSKDPSSFEEKASKEIKASKSVFKEISMELSKETDALLENAVLHEKAQTGLSEQITLILNDSAVLFQKVKNKNDHQSQGIAALNYINTLQKLNKALGEEYYLDICENSRFWTDAEARKEKVELALSETHKQLINNIRQVNENRALEFEANIDVLLSQQDREIWSNS